MAMHRICLRKFSNTAPRISPLLRPETTPIVNRTSPLLRSAAKPIIDRSWDVFISHRSLDTKNNIAGLLRDRLSQHNIKAFLKSMKPGDKMFEKIDSAILNCKLGIALFSPLYCDSDFCLQELALMVESKKKVIPIFFDVKPSDLCISKARGSQRQLERFKRALVDTKLTVGLCFDSKNGNWPKLINQVGEIVINILKEGE